MPWIKDNVSYLDHQVRANHPNTSFPAPLTQDILADFGYVWEEPAPIQPEQPTIPSQVTMRQARLALLGAGLLQTVNDTIASMPGIEGEAARIEWEYALSVDRNSALVSNLSSALNLTTEALDNLFLTASSL